MGGSEQTVKVEESRQVMELQEREHVLEEQHIGKLTGKF